MNKFKILSVSLISMTLLACSDNDSSKHSDQKISQEYQGVWHASGYGSVIKITESDYTEFKFSSTYCFAEKSEDIDNEDLKKLVALSDNKQSLSLLEGYGSLAFSAPKRMYSKVTALPDSCIQGIIPVSGDIGYEPDATLDLAIFHQLFKEYYFSFESKNVDFDALYNDVAPLVTTDTTEDQLLDYMTYMTAPLEDTHIGLISTDGIDFNSTSNRSYIITDLISEFAALNGLPLPIPEEYLDDLLIEELESYVSDMLNLQWEIITNYAESGDDIKIAANGLIRWFQNDELGYLYIGGMSGYAEEQDTDIETARLALENLDSIMDQALSELANTKGLIIDIRTNPGGNDYISLALASRFVTQNDTHVYSKQARDGDGVTPLIEARISPKGNILYQKPIVLLTSNNTVSAAEVFALSMQQLPHVTLVGETTQGALSDMLDFTLPSGIEITLSNEYYYSPQGKWMEFIGIEPDYEIEFFSQEQRILELDSGIELAAEILLEAGANN